MNVMTGNDEFEVGYNIPAKVGMNEKDIQTPCLVLDLDVFDNALLKHLAEALFPLRHHF